MDLPIYFSVVYQGKSAIGQGQDVQLYVVFCLVHHLVENGFN